MKENWDRIKTVVSLLSLLALVASLGLAAIPASKALGPDPLEAEEAAAEDRAQEQGGNIAATPGEGEPALHEGHLGYDKQTGQSLDDPTARLSVSRSPEEGAEIRQYNEQKLQGVDPTRITFRSGLTVHPQPGIEAAVLEALSAPGESADGDYYLIQFSYPFPTEARRLLAEAGVTFYDYVDVAGLYAKVPPRAMDLLQSLSADGLVRHIGAIPKEARLEPALAVQAARSPEAQNQVIVLTFDEPTPAQLADLEGLMAIERRADGPMHIVEGLASNSSIQALAELGYVRWVERQPASTPGNLDGGMGIGADVVSDAGFDGTGVDVMVIDTGIARSGTTYHPDLLSGRILDQYDYQNSDTNAADDHSHGTHVASTIGGRYNSGSSDSNRSWQGVAPGVEFLIYKLCCGTNQFSSTWFQQSLQRATSSGRHAHVSNNSWGGDNGVYNTNSEIADRAVRGEYNSQRINMVIISHNDNALSRAPGTGKNVITVGSVKDGNYPNDPFTSCGGVDDYDWGPGERVCYSNYGPIDIDGDGNSRVKPDVMAPGAMINAAAPWYRYTDSRYYQFKHGTSMAAPHVAGAVAQILDAHSSSNAWLFSWPETLKAMLLASTVDVGGNTALYGHGLVDPYHAIYFQSGIDASMSFWGNSLSSSGQTMDFTFNVPSGYEEVRVVLTWADPAGSAEVANDLDVLSVKDANGINRGSSTSYDDTVEYVRIPAGHAAGTWTVTVRAFSLSQAQAFGLATHPIMAKSDLNISSSVEYSSSFPHSVDPGAYFYFHQYVSNSGYTAGGSYARLWVPTGFTVQGVRIYTDDGHSHWYDDSEIYHPTGSNYWRVAFGETLAWNTRHARWYIQADADVAGGLHAFQSNVYWREAGSLLASGSANTDVMVTPSTYLPLVLRAH